MTEYRRSCLHNHPRRASAHTGMSVNGDSRVRMSLKARLATAGQPASQPVSQSSVGDAVEEVALLLVAGLLRQGRRAQGSGRGAARQQAAHDDDWKAPPGRDVSPTVREVRVLLHAGPEQAAGLVYAHRRPGQGCSRLRHGAAKVNFANHVSRCIY